MRESAGRRVGYGLGFALIAGALVSLGNPMQHVKADLRADGHGLKVSLEIAAEMLEGCVKRV